MLSCTSLVRGACVAALATSSPAGAADSAVADFTAALFADLTRHEMVTLAMALAVVSFSVVSAILLMRTRLRAAASETRLRSEIHNLQAEADRFRALLFAEPQILIAWAAGDSRPQISGDAALVVPQDAHLAHPQRLLAFGTWLPPEPALQMDHAVDALLESGEGFALHLVTSGGRAIEAIGRAIGGQAIVRIRELSGLRRELAEMTLRFKALQDETDALRGFAAAAPAANSASSMPPMRAPPTPATSMTRSPATSNCSTATTAATSHAR